MLKVLSVAGALLAAFFATMLIATLVFILKAEASSSFPTEVIRLVNEERSKAGVSHLGELDELTDAANVRAKEAANRFSHTRPDGSKWRTVFDEFRIQAKYRGENLAYGQPTPEIVVHDWMASAEHRKNILNEEFDHVAVGVYEQSGLLYWSQLFIQANDPSEGVAGAEEKIVLVDEPVRAGEYAVVVEIDLNVRAAPSTKSKVLTVAPLGSELLVLKIQGDWANIQMSEETKGWVSTKYIAAFIVEQGIAETKSIDSE